MRTRPRSAFVKSLKSRRCGKCGRSLNPQKKRCNHCHSVQGRPKKKA